MQASLTPPSPFMDKIIVQISMLNSANIETNSRQKVRNNRQGTNGVLFSEKFTQRHGDGISMEISWIYCNKLAHFFFFTNHHGMN